MTVVLFCRDSIFGNIFPAKFSVKESRNDSFYWGEKWNFRRVTPINPCEVELF